MSQLTTSRTRIHTQPIPPSILEEIETFEQEAKRMVAKHGFAYLDIALYHPPLYRFLEMRQELGVRNVFHPIARLLNPARASSQVIGLTHPPHFEKTAEAIRMLGLPRALVVRGVEGDPELSIAMGIKVLGIVENMSEYRCPSCGELNELFEGNTDAMCEALDLPLLGRIPFDRKLARTFDKGEPLLDETYPTIQRYQDIAGRIRTLLDYKRVLAEKL